MIYLKNLNVTGIYTLDSLVLTFDICDTSECLSDYRLDIFRSNAPESDFICVCEDLRQNSFEDKGVDLLNSQADFYYKVMIIDKRTAKTSLPEHWKNGLENLDDMKIDFEYSWSDTVMYSMPPLNNITFYLSYTYNAYLTQVVNNGTFYVAKRIFSGELCRNSDEVRGACREPMCEKCYGTGYQRGYYPPIPVRLNIMSPMNQAQTVDRTGLHNEETPTQAWCSGYPIIDVGDIIINTTDRRYRQKVIGVTASSMGTKVTRQILQLQNISPSDVTYLMPVNVPEKEVPFNGRF